MSVFDRLEAAISPATSTEGPQAPGQRSETAVDIGVDAALSLLANERRRAVLRFAVTEADGEFHIDDVVDYVTTQECGAEYTASERKRVYVSLYQAHLSRFVETGVLEADPEESQTYHATASADALFDLLETATTRFGGDR